MISKISKSEKADVEKPVLTSMQDTHDVIDKINMVYKNKKNEFRQDISSFDLIKKHMKTSECIYGFPGDKLDLCLDLDLIENSVKNDQSLLKDSLVECIEKRYGLLSNPIGEGSFGVVYCIKDKVIKIFRENNPIGNAQVFLKDRGEVVSCEIQNQVQDRVIKPDEIIYYIKEKDEMILKSSNLPTESEQIPENAVLAAVVMPFVAGKTLLKFLNEMGEGVDERSTWNITKEVALGLKSMHELCISHRDIKPDNIIIKNDGTIMIIDLGIAKKHSAPFTAPDTPIGTETYKAPEMHDGYYRYNQKEPHTRDPLEIGKEDVFSLGIILHQLLTKKLPKTSGGGGNLAKSPEIDKSLSSELRKGLEKMLEHDPQSRWSIHDVITFCDQQLLRF